MFIFLSFYPSWLPHFWKCSMVHNSGISLGARVPSCRKWLPGWYVLHLRQHHLCRRATQRCSPVVRHRSQHSSTLNLSGLGDPSKILYVPRLAFTCIKLIRDGSQSYNGGNSLPSQQAQLAQDMQSIRQTIFSSASGTIDSTMSCPHMYTIYTNSFAKTSKR